ncbi:hypothetical protein WN71_020660 [Streptomyces mangrovisoli]|uniref:Uncharacterized protein n=2 Tax=Streptomyces mangrovisoli TaxID=1428628 RepID=A0A1J4NUA6_9ACTN|nr:hypothetical protein WN71_020660 [Streptomyces mangrovisoli]
MEAMGLTRPSPVTFAAAAEHIDTESHDCTTPQGPGRVYVSPELDGWTLVIGRWCDPCDPDRSDSVLRLCTQLSQRYGKAHAFYYGERGDGSAWLITLQGTVLRRYCETGNGEDELLTLGDPLPYEQDRRRQLGLPPVWDAATEDEEAEDAWKWATFDMAPEIAAALGTSPHTLGTQTTVRGTGMLARTP